MRTTSLCLLGAFFAFFVVALGAGALGAWTAASRHSSLDAPPRAANGTFVNRTQLVRAVQLWYKSPGAAIASHGAVSDWDVSRVENMSALFCSLPNIPDCSLLFSYDQNKFNEDISKWDTSRVTDMSYMFAAATWFNRPLDTWNTARVTTMAHTFAWAGSFNQPLNSWNTVRVTTMARMFANNEKFNQPLSFDTSNVRNMAQMFSYDYDEVGILPHFNQILDFDISSVTTMNGIFYNQGGYIIWSQCNRRRTYDNFARSPNFQRVWPTAYNWSALC